MATIQRKATTIANESWVWEHKMLLGNKRASPRLQQSLFRLVEHMAQSGRAVDCRSPACPRRQTAASGQSWRSLAGPPGIKFIIYLIICFEIQKIAPFSRLPNGPSQCRTRQNCCFSRRRRRTRGEGGCLAAVCFSSVDGASGPICESVQKSRLSLLFNLLYLGSELW